MSAIRRFYWPPENIRHSDITLAFNDVIGACKVAHNGLDSLPVLTLVIIVEYVSYDSVLNHFNLVNMLSAKGPKRKPHIQLGDGFCVPYVHFYLSYVGTGKLTKLLCVTVHAPITSLKSIINLIS